MIEDHLRGIDEVAELRLPHDEAVGAVKAVAVFEAEHPGLGKRAVNYVNRPLVLGDVLERGVGQTGLDIVQDRVALAERAAPAVLT